MLVHFEIIKAHIAQITINRPNALNALNQEAMDAFAIAVDHAQKTPDLRVLILTGSGDRAFCAGGDLYELKDAISESDGQNLSQGMTQTLNLLEKLPYPTIAAINGLSRGGGVEIALACDIRIISDTTDLGMTQIKLGLSPGWGGGGRLLRVVGYARALEWLVTGKVLSAAEAHEFGLVNYLAPKEEVLTRALSIASQIAQQNPNAIQGIKTLLQAGIFSPGKAASIETQIFPPLWASEAHHKRVDQFISRKQDN